MRRDCDIPNPLVRHGTGQAERLPAALDPAYVKVDERGPDDLLCFVQRYASLLQYYDSENRPAGDWRPFVEKDVSVVIALIANYDARVLNNCYEIFKPAAVDAHIFAPAVKSALGVLFDLIFTSAATFDRWYGRTAEGLAIHTELNRVITAQLGEALRSAIAAYRYADDNQLIAPVDPALLPQDSRDILLATEQVLARPFHPDWIAGPAVPAADWSAYLASIAPDAGAFENATKAGGRLTALYEIFYTALRQIIDRSPEFMAETLERWPQHEPHMALMLAFFKLFQIAQADLNALTRRHLEFYYEKVLRLAPKPAQPDRVHLLLELAKQAKPHTLAKGTLLKAGKDASGKNLVYQTLRQIVVNQAAVKSLKTVYIDRDDNDRVYAAPQADSRDGQGEAFDSAEPRWKTFGQSQRTAAGTYRSGAALTMPFATIGFALASPILLLNEGQRTITMRLAAAATASPAALSPDQFEIRFSGEEDWLIAPASAVSVTVSPLVLTIELGPEFPAIVGYDPKLLGGNFDTRFPIVQVLLKNLGQAIPAHAHGALKDIVLTAISLNVVVSGVRNLIVQNDNGLLDASKPFQPFGAQPVVGAGFYIGSDEVFRKQLSALTLTIDWLDLPSDSPAEDSPAKDSLEDHYSVYKDVLEDSYAKDQFKANVFELKNNSWDTVKKPADTETILAIDLFETNNDTSSNTETITSLNLDRAPLLDAIERYDNRSRQGFIKLELSAPAHAFGHADFAALYTRQVLALSAYEQLKPAEQNNTTEPLLPEQPYTPTVKTLELGYVSEVAFDLSPSPPPTTDYDRFFHIYPFGQMRPEPTASKTVRLMPAFETDTGGDVSANQGELYIGIAGLDPPRQISLLIQVAEGSADPDLPKQVVHWSYLDGERWRPFKSSAIVADGTNGLLTSGIIVFNVPAEADQRHTVLTDGLHWLRAGVTANTNAVCDLIDIKAQAVTAEFKDQGNDADFLSRPLPAKSIKKLVVKQAAVKSITQPYASFGGAMPEKGRQYYTRVSERLRHKGRAIAIWDFERLVLEKFPEIHRVKCINHSTYGHAGATDEPAIDSSEFAPGFVTVIVIPQLDNKNAVDPLEPRASLKTLERIRQFLAGRMSPFAARRLKVINPLFEQIEVVCGAMFYPAYDRGETELKLNRDIVRFLSPWAYEQGRDIVFGGRVHRSMILNFIEERPYVDYVTDFSMNHVIGETRSNDVEFALPTTARSVFVSASQHTINPASSCP
jgi:hypothetical protein